MGLVLIEEASRIHGYVTHREEGQYDTWVCYSWRRIPVGYIGVCYS